MNYNCEFCGHEKLDVIVEYGFDMESGNVKNREIGTINAVCDECNREQYLAKEDLPEELLSSLL